MGQFARGAPAGTPASSVKQILRCRGLLPPLFSPFWSRFSRLGRRFGGFMQRFDGVDFLEIDGLLNEEELAVRGLARQFVTDRLMPIIEKHNRAGTFPMDLIPEMAELGFYGANIQGYECAGLNNVAYGLIMQELERGDSRLRSFVSV